MRRNPRARPTLPVLALVALSAAQVAASDDLDACPMEDTRAASTSGSSTSGSSTSGSSGATLLAANVELLGRIGPDAEQRYVFDAKLGQSVQLRVADLTGGRFTPSLSVYDPSGCEVYFNASAGVIGGELTLATSGRYRIVVGDAAPAYEHGGDFALSFALVPGAAEVAITGGRELRAEAALGDLDSYTFSGLAGQTVLLRVADVARSWFTPGLWLYEPSGASVLFASDGTVAGGEHTLQATGQYTLVVADYSMGFGNRGDYTLSLEIVPATGELSHDLLSSPSERRGQIGLGELDVYAFEGQAGEALALSVDDESAAWFTPALWLYDPQGALVHFDSGTSRAGAQLLLASAGRYTVVVGDYSMGYGSTGKYRLSFALRAAGNAAKH